MPASPARTRRWVFGLKLGGFYLAVALITLEMGLRIFWTKQLIPGAGIEQPHFHHRLLPNRPYRFASSEFDVTITTNRYGLRGPDPVVPKPTGTFRILMLGDSYTFGFPVRDEETFASLAQQALRAQGYPVEIINGGVSGYSPTLHYISLRDQFLTFEPDLIVLWYDLGDLMEDHAFQKNLIYDAEDRIVRCDPRYHWGRFNTLKWAHDHSALMKYINTKLLGTVGKIKTLGLREYVRAKLRGERSKTAIARLKRQQLATDLAAHDKFLLVREDTTPEIARPYWKLSATYLRMIRDLLRERDIPLVLGVYPYGMVVGPDQWADGRVAWGFEKGRTYSAAAFLTLMREFTQAERIPLIETFDAFAQAAAHERLFYNWDGHFTPTGHRVVAAQFVGAPQLTALLPARATRQASRTDR